MAKSSYLVLQETGRGFNEGWLRQRNGETELATSYGRSSRQGLAGHAATLAPGLWGGSRGTTGIAVISHQPTSGGGAPVAVESRGPHASAETYSRKAVQKTVNYCSIPPTFRSKQWKPLKPEPLRCILLSDRMGQSFSTAFVSRWSRTSSNSSAKPLSSSLERSGQLHQAVQLMSRSCNSTPVATATRNPRLPRRFVLFIFPAEEHLFKMVISGGGKLL